MVKKLLVLLSCLLISKTVFADWKYNPHTNKPDYYEAGTSGTDLGTIDGLVEGDGAGEYSAASTTGDSSVVVTGTAGEENDCAKWDASGNLMSAGAECGGAGGSPEGNDKSIQFNDNGSFAGDDGLAYDKTNGIFTLGTNDSSLKYIDAGFTLPVYFKNYQVNPTFTGELGVDPLILGNVQVAYNPSDGIPSALFGGGIAGGTEASPTVPDTERATVVGFNAFVHNGRAFVPSGSISWYQAGEFVPYTDENNIGSTPTYFSIGVMQPNSLSELGVMYGSPEGVSIRNLLTLGHGTDDYGAAESGRIELDDTISGNTASLNPSASMTSDADFYFPVDEPVSDSILEMSTGGQIGYATDGTDYLSPTTGVSLTGDQSVGGVKTFTSIPVLPDADPTTGNEAVRKSYVDAFAQGIQTFLSVQYATTANVNLASDLEVGDTVDDGTLASGDRIMVKNQSTQSANGIYVAGSPATRASDFDSTAEADQGTAVTVVLGTANGNSLWVQATDDPVIDTDPIVFNQLPAPDPITASTGIKRVGNDLQADLSDTNPSLEVSDGGLRAKVDGNSMSRTASGLAVHVDGSTILGGASGIYVGLITDSNITGQILSSHGGTGITLPSANRVLGVNSAGNAYEGKDIVGGTNVTVDHSANTITINSALSGTADYFYSTVPIAENPGTTFAWTNLPAALTAGSVYLARKVDLTGAVQFRLVMNQSVAGYAGSKLRAYYSTNGGTNYYQLEDTSTGGDLDVGTGTGLKTGAWVDVVSGAKQEAQILLYSLSGDGVADPAFRSMQVQIKYNSTIVEADETSLIYREAVIHSHPASALAWTNMPAALSEFISAYVRQKIDLSSMSQYRIVVNQSVAGYAGSDINLRYSNNGTTFFAADTGDAGALDVGTGTGVKVGPWTDLSSGAKGDVWISLFSKEGDGVADPAWRQIFVQFKGSVVGEQGPAGAQGPQGEQGPQGVQGPAGEDGEGVPEGGTTGQVLSKKSGTNFDTEWVDQTGGGTSVLVNSSSVTNPDFTSGGNIDFTVTESTVTANLDTTLKSNYDSAYGWGDHSAEGYLTAEVDGSTTNELQDLSLDGHELSLSSDLSTVDLSSYLDNTDAQDLSKTNDVLSLTGDESTVDLSEYYNSLLDLQSAVTSDFHNLGGTDATDDSVSGAELDGVFSENGLLKRTGDDTYTVDTNTYLTTESDPTIGTLENTKWCTSDGDSITCTEDAPASTSAASVQRTVTQASHGFSVGNLIRHNGSAYVKAQADTVANSEVVGIVSAVDGNDFTFVTSGYVSTLSGLTAGVTYFLSDDTAGALTATEPTGSSVSKPVFVASSTTAGYFINYRGLVTAPATGMTLASSLSEGDYYGIYESGTAGATLAFGDLIYFNDNDSRWELADANVSDGYDKKLGICVLAAANDGDATTVLLYGKVNAATAFPSMTVGAVQYISETPGDVVGTAPTTTDSATRVIGHANTADELFFNPSNDYYTHT